jgi:uncharacterized protein (DUF924 family)
MNERDPSAGMHGARPRLARSFEWRNAMTLRTKGYWLATGLLAADFAYVGTSALLGAPFIVDALAHLGYPRYFAAILGSWKVLGAIALLVPGRPRLKEWAYAGIFFDLTGAALSHAATGDGVAAIAAPVVLLGVWLASWTLCPPSRRSGAAQAAGAPESAELARPSGAVPASASALLLIASALGSFAGCAADSPTQAQPAPKSAPTAADAAAVVSFWREAGPRMWFAKDPAFDRRFRERFIVLHEAAARHELEHWMRTPEGALALLILLDQFPRNAFRGSPHMYATDAHARAIAERAIAAGHDRAIDKELRLFMYLPFGHSEDIADQERSVKLSESLGEPSLTHAKGHHDIVKRFGRFPHRNPILGRAMRPEEQKFLDEGGFAG